jgi:hypothetical protein
MMILPPILWAIMAHYIGDVALQTPFMAEFKKKSWYGMLNHVMVWAACISVVLEIYGICAVWKVFFLAGGHAMIDRWKSRLPPTPEYMWALYGDQGLHMIQIAIVVYL